MGFEVCLKEMENPELKKPENPELTKITELLDLYQLRPHSKRELDQFPVALPGIFKQVSAMQPLIKGRHIVLLGGHDGDVFVLDSYSYPQKITVLEIDKDTCEWIKKPATEKNLRIEVIQCDLCEPFTAVANLIGNVDVVRCDPTYNCAGCTLWVMRATQLLKLGGDFFICLPVGSDWAWHVTHKAVYQILPKFGFSLVKFFEFLNHYPQVEGMVSTFWHFKLRKKFPIQDAEFPFDIHHPSPEFCIKKMKCEVYSQCITSRKNWKNLRRVLYTQVYEGFVYSCIT